MDFNDNTISMSPEISDASPVCPLFLGYSPNPRIYTGSGRQRRLVTDGRKIMKKFDGVTKRKKKILPQLELRTDWCLSLALREMCRVQDKKEADTCLNVGEHELNKAQTAGPSSASREEPRDPYRHFSPSTQESQSSTPSDVVQEVFVSLNNRRKYAVGKQCVKKRNNRKKIVLPKVIKNEELRNAVSSCCKVVGKGRGIIWSTPKTESESLCSPGLTPISRGRSLEGGETPLRSRGTRKEQSSVFVVSRGSVVEFTVEACLSSSSLKQAQSSRNEVDDSYSLVESSVDSGPLTRQLERLCLGEMSGGSQDDTYSQVRRQRDTPDSEQRPTPSSEDHSNGMSKSERKSTSPEAYKSPNLCETAQLDFFCDSLAKAETSADHIQESQNQLETSLQTELGTSISSPFEAPSTDKHRNNPFMNCSRAKLSNQEGHWLQESKVLFPVFQTPSKISDECKPTLKKSFAVSCSEDSFDEDSESSPRRNSLSVSGAGLRPDESVGDECDKMSLSSDSSSSVNDRGSQSQDLDHLRSPDASSVSSRSAYSPFFGFSSSSLPLLPGTSALGNLSGDWGTLYAKNVIKTSQGTSIIKSKSTSSLRKQLDPTSPTPGRRGYPMKKCLSEGSWLNRSSSSIEPHWEGSRSRSLTRHEDRLSSPLPSVSEENQDENSECTFTIGTSHYSLHERSTDTLYSDQHSGSQDLALPPSLGDSESESGRDVSDSLWCERDEVGSRSNHQHYPLDYIAEEEADEIDNLEPFPPTQERVYLMAGKKYRRSLSIMHLLSETTDLSIGSNRGRGFHDTVQQVITMQRTGVDGRRGPGLNNTSTRHRSARRQSTLHNTMAATLHSSLAATLQTNLSLAEVHSPGSPTLDESNRLAPQPDLTLNPLSCLINDFRVDGRRGPGLNNTSTRRRSARLQSTLHNTMAATLQTNLTLAEETVDQPEVHSPGSPTLDESNRLAPQPVLTLNPLACLINDFMYSEEVEDDEADEDKYEKLIKYLSGQSEPCSFDDILDDVELDSVKKVGEGVYGEVFSYSRDERKLALKVLPVKGEFKVNGEDQKDFIQISDELLITRALSDLDNEDWYYQCSSFVKLSRVWLIRGEYPKTLLSLWDQFDREKGSYNDRPTIFPEDQLYLGLELAHGGQDLENYKFSSASQSLSAFKQVVHSLAVAEEAYKFEHRDLHWGNILISRTTEKTLYFQIGDTEFQVKTNGVKATIIDYTLSRLTMRSDAKFYNDVADDEDLFAGKGDIQFDVYRQMREELKNDWSQYAPKTNVLWLSYLVQKLLEEAQYSRKSARVHLTSLATLRSIHSWIGSCSSAFAVAQRLSDTKCISDNQ